MANRIFVLLVLTVVAGALASGCILSVDKDPCQNVTCGNGHCVEMSGSATCECDVGYRADGLSCVPDGAKLTFTWIFGDEKKTCTQAQVGNVKVELFRADTSLFSETLACSAGGGKIEQLEDGAYTLELTGISNSQESTYFVGVPFTISGQNQDKGELVLDPIGFVSFSWNFGANDADCATAKVDKVKIKLNSEDGTENLYTSIPVLSCTNAPAEFGDFFLGKYNLVLEGFCANDPSVIGFRLDNFLDITDKGENNFGPINIPENAADPGGCP